MARRLNLSAGAAPRIANTGTARGPEGRSPAAADIDDGQPALGRPGGGHRRPAQGQRRHLAPLRRPWPRGSGAAPPGAEPGHRRTSARRRRRPSGRAIARRRPASAGMDGTRGGLAALAAAGLAGHRGGPLASRPVARRPGRRRRGAAGAGLCHRQPSRSQAFGCVLRCARFAAWCRAAPLPVYALGGITAETAGRLAASSAAGIAAIGGLAAP